VLPIEAALADLRIAGAVLLHERYAPGAAIAVPDEPALRVLMGHGPHVKVAPFHLVLKGSFDLESSTGKRSTLQRNDVAVCLDGGAHELCFGKSRSSVPLSEVLAGRARLPNPNSSDATELICGVFAMRSLPLNPLLAALPPILRCRTQGDGVAPFMAMASQMLQAEMTTPARAGTVFTRARLLEIFFAEAIRAYQSGEVLPVGWFQGLSDARIAAALTAFHQEPAKEWSVERLAARSSLSASRFAARFREALGLAAMEYVARWRIHMASRLLEDSENTLDAIAHATGYGGGAALGKAFKDRVGSSPGTWRASRRAVPLTTVGHGK
jgi:AraC-like DNA-binding protein